MRMGKGPLPRFFGALLVCCCCTACAGDARFGHGLLFEITGEAARPCHLFGTIHSEDPRVLALPTAVRGAFDRADVFVMEAIPDTQAIIRSMLAMVYTDGRRLEDTIGSDLYRQALEALSDQGLPEKAVADFKPWAVAIILGVPRPKKSGDFLDMHLYKVADAAGKEVIGLESIEEQLQVFDGLAEADQIALLRETLKMYEDLPRYFEQLMTLYLERDLAELMRLSDEYLRGGDPRLAAIFKETALDVRNLRMAQRMVPHLEEGGCFIAVGALHLPGEGGVLERLQGDGFQVRTVY